MQLHRVRVRIENVLKGFLTDRTGLSTISALLAASLGRGRWDLAQSHPGAFSGYKGIPASAYGLRRTGSYRNLSKSGAHPQYKPEQGSPLGYALADILFTRGQGKINEDSFARDVAWGTQHHTRGLPAQEVHAPCTDRGPSIRAAACSQLWIYTQDGAAGAGSRRNAVQSMQNAGCRCEPKPDGMPRCRSRIKMLPEVLPLLSRLS